MKKFLVIAALLSANAFAAPGGTCKGDLADIVGPKVDASAVLTTKCVLNEYRSTITVYEYTDAQRKENGAAIVDVGSGSAVSDAINRVTYPGEGWKEALLERLTDQDSHGLSRAEAEAELKKVSCKSLR